jgi:hypothetical protein
MSKVAILRAPAGNDVEIVSMVFPSFEAGVEYVKTALAGVEPKEQGEYSFNFDEVPDYYLAKYKAKDGMRYAYWKVNLENEDEKTEEENPLSDKFFTGYYGGCGECDSIYIEEVNFAVPLVAFNLD